MNFYNDNDPKSCAWLRELIRAGEIPDGVVDERSILDVQPADVAGFVQCHFFAGIGGWSYALKLAGWPENSPVWTGSCPCQPYSAAGRGKGDADARNLWPAFFRLIKTCKPQCVIGEQVAAAIGHGWLDGICDDLEGEGYTTGAAVLGACSVGAPHIRQRLYWVGHAQGIGRSGRQNDEDSGRRELASGHSGAGDSGLALAQSEQPHGSRDARGGRGESSDGGNDGGVADASSPRCIGPIGDAEGQTRNEARMLVSGEHSEDGGLVQSDCAGREPREQTTAPARHGGSIEPAGGDGGVGDTHEPGLQISQEDGERTDQKPAAFPSSHWSNYELIPCADGKARRIESGSAPLVAKFSGVVVPGGDPGVEEAQNSGEARVMRLRGYGNAVNAVTAAQFIKAVMGI